MKYVKFFLGSILSCIFSAPAFSQTPEFTYNGAADVILKYPPRGSGGRAVVHDGDNALTLNYGGDFSGGTRIGNSFYVSNAGNLRALSWQPFGATSDDFFIDVIPGTRILRTRNSNIESPNVGATGIHTGDGLFEGSIGIGTTSPEEMLELRSSAPVQAFHQPGVATYKVGVPYGVFKIAAMDIGFGAIVGSFPSSDTQVFVMDKFGKIGIGTLSPKEQLSVNGKIRAQEIKVEAINWPDYVFAQEHKLVPLQEIESFIKTNQHLPEIPSAKEVEKNGLSLGEMNAKLLKKIEELTLYLIEKDKQLINQEQRLKDVERQLAEDRNH